MENKSLLKLGDEIKSLIPVNAKVETTDTSVIVSGEINVGVKGLDITVECSERTVKIKGSREYKYPIDEGSADKFQKKMIEKHEGYSIFVSGQTLSFSKFLSFESEEATINHVKDAIKAMESTVLYFEDNCVNFLDKESGSSNDEEYDPEKNIDIVNVDNSFKAVLVTEQDNKAYELEHNKFTEETFHKLSKKLNAIEKNDSFKVSKGNKLITVILLRDENEILISVSIPLDRDVSAMYQSYIKANYSEFISSFNNNEERFYVKMYVTPDEYTPNAVEEALIHCEAAVDACINEYAQTLEKKDSSGFASDVQKILIEQTSSLEEREALMTEKEKFMAEKEVELKQREHDLEQQIVELQNSKKELEKTMESERLRIKEKEDEMSEIIRQYEERNTKDILNIQQLANQVAALQNKQNMLGIGDSQAEEEIVRLKSKVQQMISQKVMMEKKLKEQLSVKDGKIRELTDMVNSKAKEVKEIEERIDDIVESKVSESAKKTSSYIKKLETQVNEAGHILTPEELIKYLEQYYRDSTFKKFHAPNAKFVVFNDESLEVRVRFGETNYVDVSKEATLKDQVLKKLNSKHGDIKFFSKENKIIARTYFANTATVEKVDEVIETLSSNFAK